MNKALLLALSLVLVLTPLAEAGERTTAPEEGDEASSRLIVLRIKLAGDPGEEIEIAAYPGQPVRIHDRDSDVIRQLVVGFDSGLPDRLTLETQEVVKLGGRELPPSLLSAVPLPLEGEVDAFDGAISVAWSGFRSLTSSHPPEPQNLHPRNCCITCNGTTACGPCVEMSCGSCCVMNS